jgi:hypothetical protein
MRSLRKPRNLQRKNIRGVNVLSAAMVAAVARNVVTV